MAHSHEVHTRAVVPEVDFKVVAGTKAEAATRVVVLEVDSVHRLLAGLCGLPDAIICVPDSSLSRFL